MSIISENAVSFTELVKELTNYLKSKPEYKKWKDLFESSTGQTLIELIAGYGSLMSYRLAKARQESYLVTANSRTSLISQAETLGYSVYRGYPPKLSITFSPTIYTYIDTLEIVGTYEGFDVVAIKSGSFSVGSTYTIDLVIGYYRESTIDIVSNDTQLFRFVLENVSEVVALFLNNIEVPTSNQYSDLINDKYLLITSPFGIDVTYLNSCPNAQYKYNSGDILKLKYVELISSLETFDSSKLVLTKPDGVISISFTDRINPETEESIRINTPLHNETQLVVRGRGDFKKIFKLLYPEFLDVNQNSPLPLSVELTYLTNDQSLLTVDQKSKIISDISNRLPYGFPDPTIVDPVAQTLTLDITLDVFSESGVENSTITNDIDTILADYEKLFGVTIDIDLLIKKLYEKTYIKSAQILVNSGVTTLGWNEYIWKINYNLIVNYV